MANSGTFFATATRISGKRHRIALAVDGLGVDGRFGAVVEQGLDVRQAARKQNAVRDVEHGADVGQAGPERNQQWLTFGDLGDSRGILPSHGVERKSADVLGAAWYDDDRTAHAAISPATSERVLSSCLRRDRRRHPRPQPDDGQLPARVLRLRAPRRQGRRREGERLMARRHRSAEDRRGRRRAPVRLGAQGHPAGPPRRARRRGRQGDLGARAARPPDDPHATSRWPRTRRTSSARTPGSPSTTAGSASTSRSIRRGSTRPSTTAPSARPSSTRSARTPCTRSRARTPARTSATASPSSTGTSSPAGTGSTSSACPRARAPRT